MASDAGSETHVDVIEAEHSDTEDIAYRVSDVERRQESQSKQIEALRDEFYEFKRQVESQKEALTTENQSLATELEAARERIRELESQTNMLQLVEEADNLDYKQRRIALLHQLERKAQAKADNPSDAVQTKMKASIDLEGAKEALHHPEIDRTTLYDDMRKAAELVGNKDVCAYENGELTMNLERTESGELPSAVVGGANGS